MEHLDLFSGIGGFALAAQWVWGEEHHIHSFVEIEPFCQKVLKKHWPDTPIHDDIRSYKHDGTAIDLLTGGFPCQPFSCAGKQRSKEDDRYLWPSMLECIRTVRPTWVIGENVAGIINLALDQVLAELEDSGYSGQAFIIPACAVDAPHRRDRVWVVANNRLRRCDKQEVQSKQQGRTDVISASQNMGNAKELHINGGRGKRAKIETQVSEPGNTSGANDMADTTSKGLQERERQAGEKRNAGVRPKQENEPSRRWLPEPNVGRRFDGLPSWLYRHIGRGLSYAESQRRCEILRKLWSKDVAEKVWETLGGFDRIQKAEILFSVVRQHETRPNQTRLFLESQKALEGFVRSLWVQGEITGTPHRPTDRMERSGKYTDSLQTLSRLLAHPGETNWQISDWEDGIPRVSSSVPGRVDRLKALGNAIVPQVVAPIMQAIKEIDQKESKPKPNN